MDDKWLLVENFADLKLGMRVRVACGLCGSQPRSILTEFVSGGSRSRYGARSSQDCWLSLPVHVCSGDPYPNAIGTSTVAAKMVFRFAADEGISDRLAREVNPYVTRSVVGTAGRDEVVIARKERAR